VKGFVLGVELSYVSDFDYEFVFYVTILVEFYPRLHIRNLNIIEHLRRQHLALLHFNLRRLNLEVNELLIIRLRPNIITARLLLWFLV